MNFFHIKQQAFFLILTVLITACSTHQTQEEELPQYVRDTLPTRTIAQDILKRLPEPVPISEKIILAPLTLSPGDRVRIAIQEGEEFNGIFEINIDGKLNLPYLEPLMAAGQTIAQLEQQMIHQLIKNGFFRADFIQASVKPLQWRAVRVTVTGAVFQPGRILINDRPVARQAQQQTQQTGDYPTKRYLSAALKGAGGIRPDADIKSIRLIRHGKHQTIDLSGILTGEPVLDIPLIDGDQIVVPSLGYFQTELIRPSQLTPPGFKVFMSNLVIPSPSNAQASIGSGMLSIPYGTRLLRAAVAGNCVGGIQTTNASRSTILISTNPFNGKTQVIKRAIEDLITNADDDILNPYIMPNDGIACYDSGMTSMRDIAGALVNFLTPAVLIKTLLSNGTSD